MPDTAQHGQNELVRMWRGQVTKPGMIIDERFNSGGQIPDRFIELLNRPLRNYWAVRDGKDWTCRRWRTLAPRPCSSTAGAARAAIVSPFSLNSASWGPLIGMRTWGGLIGITGSPPLWWMAGSVTVPTFAIYNTKGEWIIEGYGVDPDIEVVDDPAAMARGGDPQLERAVAEVLKSLKKTPPPSVKKPAYPNRAK